MTRTKTLTALIISTGLFMAPASVSAAEDEPHPANDTVLGLTVVSESGKPMGYVLDAPVDTQGAIEAIRVAKFHTGETVEETFDLNVSCVMRVDGAQVVVEQHDVDAIPVAGNRIPKTGSRS